MSLNAKEINNLLKGAKGIKVKKPTKTEGMINDLRWELNKRMDEEVEKARKNIINWMKTAPQCPNCKSFDIGEDRTHNGIYGPGSASSFDNYTCNQCGTMFQNKKKSND